MTQKGLARHINAIRRFQSQLGTSSKAKRDKTRLSSLVQEQTTARLLDKLHPTLNLCDFHPFTQQIQFDLAGFDQSKIPGEDSCISSSKQNVAENSSDKATDTKSELLATNFYQHISHLVIEMEQVLARSGDLTADKEVIAPANNNSSVLLSGQFVGRELRLKPPGKERRTGKKSAVTAPHLSALRAQTHIKQDVHAKWSLEKNNVARQFTTVFQKIVENMQELEQTTVTSPTPSEETSMPFAGGKAWSASTTPSAIISPGSQTMLHRLTDSIWPSQDNFKTTRSGSADKAHHIRKMIHTAPLQNETNDRKYAANPERKPTAAAGHGGKNVPPSTRPFVSLPSAETSFSSPVAQHTAIHPRHANFSFQDVGRLEALKVADALSEYLQEQAGLNGVDLS